MTTDAETAGAAAPPEGPCERGCALLKAGRYALALEELTEAIRLEPGRAEAHAYRGAAFYNTGDYELAVVDCDEALRLQPENALALRCRSAAFYQLCDNEGAIADASDVIRLVPHDPRGFLLRGNAFLEVGDLERAAEDFSEAVRCAPGDTAGYQARGMALLRMQEHERALEDLNEAVRLAPQSGWAVWGRGRAHLEQGRFEEAVADFTEALRLHPEWASVHGERAQAWEGLGKFDRAEVDRLAGAVGEEGGTNVAETRTRVYPLLEAHFQPTKLDELVVTERAFPPRVRADLQRAIDGLPETLTVRHFLAARKSQGDYGITMTGLLARDLQDPAVAGPPQYEEVDVGEAETVRCLHSGLWLLQGEGAPLAVYMGPCVVQHGLLCFQVAALKGEAGERATRQFFRHVEETVSLAPSYRGKVLSLEWHTSYAGTGTGIKVHRLRPVRREEVILPRPTLELLERNVVRFVRQRGQLAGAGLGAKKGVLFYGPPGTGKTHTLHYLVGELKGTTTFLITAEQIGLLGEYMTLARLLQPSTVVIEDADLVGGHRAVAGGPAGHEVLLSQLLNEMDGLREDADVLFILTTNRPEVLEPALASRPGRVDQAIEFPYPDDEGRARLLRLYARGLPLPEEVVQATVRKTQKVSAAFIKELVRRSAQFRLERGGSDGITIEDVDGALQEMLFRGGALNRKLLGCAGIGFVPPDGGEAESV